MSNTFKADLIGVYDHVNSKTGVPFKGLSFRVAPGKIASIGANDKRDEAGNIVEAVGEKLQKAFDEAKARGVGLLFDVSNAILVEETEELDDGTAVPLIIDGTRYYKIAGASLGVSPTIKKVGEIPRGGVSATFVL